MTPVRAELRREHVRRRRRRSWLRARAVLAGGLVLGIGAAVTLAAWTDNEYSTATVASGRFGIVGAMSGGAFGDHSSSPGATLTFAPALGAIYPGVTGYTGVQIRSATVASGGFDSVPGVVRMQTATAATGTLAAALVYAVRIIPAASTCNATTFAASTTIVVADNTALTTAVPASGVNTQTLQAAGGNTLAYCIQIGLPTTAADNTQNGTATVVWQFAGSTS